jgi:cytoskeletal protein CcmA (bactofilin family)
MSMWSDRKPQEDSPKPPPPVARPEAPAPEPKIEKAGRIATAESQGVAIIAQSMIIKGQIKSAEHMHIAGEVDGSLDLTGYDLTVTAESKVRANVNAREVDIAGSIQGNVTASRKITIRTGGKLIGDLRTPGIVIEDGCYFKGNIEIVTREPRPDGKEGEQPLTLSASAKG